MITSLIDKFSRISGYRKDQLFEFVMDFDSMNGIEYLCTDTDINIIINLPGKVIASLLTLSITDYDHCVYIMPKEIISSFRDYPDIAERYLEFFVRLLNRDVNDVTDISNMTFCYADIIKVINCAEILQQYYKNMVDEVNFGL